MMKKVLAFLFFVILYSYVKTAVVRKITHSEGYYWRDYLNRFPSDAFQAGINIDGTPIYIAQVLYRDSLISGTIGENQSHAVFEYGTKKLTTSENIKILCTNFPQDLKWINTTGFLFRLVMDDYCIYGGYEKDYKVYIGRGYHKGRWLIGKVIVNELEVPIVFHTIENEQSIRLDIFQVLRLSPISVDIADIAIANVISNPPEVTNELYYTDAYYWRDFDNHIPFDAFSAGDDKNMLPIYIGQVLHKDSLFPGTLNIEEKEVVYEYASKEFVRTKNVKILCSNYPQYLEWRRIGDAKISRNNNVIVGGYEKSYFVYIGRGVSKDEIVVGKLIPINGRCQLQSILNNAAVRLQSYETLVVKQIGAHFTATTDSSETLFTTTDPEIAESSTPSVVAPVLVDHFNGSELDSDFTATTESSETTNSAIAGSPTPSLIPADHYNGNGSVSKTVIINHYHFYNVSNQPSKCENHTVIINIY